MSDPYSKPQKLVRDAVVGMAARLCYLVSRVAMAPILLSFISLQELGVWSLCFAILSYVALGGFGLHSAYIQLTSRFHAASDFEAVRKLLGTGVSLTVCLGSLGFGVMVMILPVLIQWLNIEAGLADPAKFLILGTTLCFLLDMALGSFRSALEGFHEISLVKQVQTAVALVEVVLILVFLHLGFGLYGLLYAYALRIVLEGLVFYLLLRRRMQGGVLRICWDRDVLREFMVFGGQVQVSGAVGMVTSSLDRLWITRLVGLQATGVFELARKFPFTAKSLSGAAFGSFLPLAARLSKDGSDEAMGPLYLGGTRNISLFNACLFVFLIAAQGPLIEVWLGSNTDGIAAVMAYLAVSYFIQQLTGPAVLIFRGMKQVCKEWFFVMPHFLLLLVGLPLGVHFGGTEGAALAIVLGTSVAAGLLLHQANSSFSVSWQELAAKVLAPSLLPVVPGVFVWMGLGLFEGEARLVLLMAVVSSGLLYVLACVGLYWVLVLTDEEKEVVASMAQRAGAYVKA